MTKFSFDMFEEQEELDNDNYTFANVEKKVRFYDNELKKKLGTSRRFICWDGETQLKLQELYEIVADAIFMDDVRHAERGMSAVAMGFDPYDVINDSSDYYYCLLYTSDAADD